MAREPSHVSCIQMITVIKNRTLFQFSIAFYNCGDAAKFEELTRALVPVIVRDVKEDEEASVVCGCLEALVRFVTSNFLLLIIEQHSHFNLSIQWGLQNRTRKTKNHSKTELFKIWILNC